MNKKKIKKILIWTAVSLLALGALTGIGLGIWFYIDEVIPKEKAAQILKEEKKELYALEGEELYDKCKNIIRYRRIPKSGDKWRDEDNLDELTEVAWTKIRQLAENGHPNSQFFLACFYAGYDYETESWRNDRFNSNYDMKRAAYWYLQAANQGHAGAQNNLGNCYKNGNGVKKDLTAAFKLFKRAAHSGDDLAQLNLGDFYFNGHKIKKGSHKETIQEFSVGYGWVTREVDVDDYAIENLDSAMFYWKLSAAQGNETAKERLEKIY